jgi:YHS domain-containing protein
MPLDIRQSINANCPISGKPVAADSLMEYEGRVIGFCTQEHRQQFHVLVDFFAGSLVEHDNAKLLALHGDMRRAWVDHVYWARMLTISATHKLPDAKEVAGRFFQASGDISAVFGQYYSKQVADNIAQLVTEHLQHGAGIVGALLEKKTSEAQDQEKQWYANAAKMADALAAINPCFKRDIIGDLLHTHLDLIAKFVMARIGGKYADDVAAAGELEAEVIKMADYLAAGIVAQFIDQFKGEKS